MKQRKGRKTVIAALTILMIITGLMPTWVYGQEPVSEPVDSQKEVLQETEGEDQGMKPGES